MVEGKCAVCGRALVRAKLLSRMICKDCKRDLANKYRRDHKTGAKAVKKNRASTKHKAVELMGGKCKICGYSKCEAALEFHHLDPSKKDFAIGGTIRYSWSKVAEELKKCIMVCSNCHVEIHAGVTEYKSGS